MTEQEALDALGELRIQIDQVDLEILSLLNRRTQIVQDIARIKQAAGFAVYEPNREEQVFRNVTGQNSGPMPSDAVKRVFERIMDEMRAYQRARMEMGK